MCRKAKHDHEKLSSLAELVQKFKFLQNSCMGNVSHETEQQGVLPLIILGDKKKMR